MKEIIDALRKGDIAFAGVLLLVLKVRLLARKENSKLKRKIGTKKREMIKVIKKL